MKARMRSTTRIAGAHVSSLPACALAMVRVRLLGATALQSLQVRWHSVESGNGTVPTKPVAHAKLVGMARVARVPQWIATAMARARRTVASAIAPSQQGSSKRTQVLVPSIVSPATVVGQPIRTAGVGRNAAPRVEAAVPALKADANATTTTRLVTL